VKITKEELINLSSHDKSVSVDRPFNKPGHRNRIIFDALRHQESKKIFGLVYEKDDALYIDLKCDSRNIDELVSTFPYILTGQHFTKQHWITLDIQQLPSKDELIKLVDASYHLTD